MRAVTFSMVVIFYLFWPNARLDFSSFNAHDSEYYLSLSHAWAAGIGYTRSLNPELYLPHTTWPPGIPALMLPATLLGGAQLNLYLAKYTIILVAIVGIGLVWFYSRMYFSDQLVVQI